MDVGSLLRRAAAESPLTIAVDDGASARPLGELLARSERFANGLRGLGLQKGDAVGVLAENRIEYPEVDVALLCGGFTRVALNARLGLEDFRQAAADCRMRVLVFCARHAAEAEALRTELGLVTIALDAGSDGMDTYERLIADAPADTVVEEIDDEAPGAITYTSGTTGKPKGVVLSRRALREVALNLLIELGRPRTGEKIVLTQPLSHGAGYFVLPYLMCGAGIQIMDRFDPERVVALSHRPDIRTFKAVPAMLPRVLEAARASGCGYEHVIYGAAPISPPLLAESQEVLGPVLTQIYGQSEAPMSLTVLHAADHIVGSERANSAGRPWRTVAVEICDDDGRPVPKGEPGEIRVRGRHMMTRYLNRPEETAAVLVDGWIRTRDAGRIDGDGFVHLLGRTDEMLNTGGFNVSPREVERAVLEHDQVGECVVVGVPDERWGTAIAAVVTPAGDAPVVTEELVDFLRPRLGFRAPKRIVILDEIPRNAYGKVDRTAVNAAVAHRPTALHQGGHDHVSSPATEALWHQSREGADQST